MKPTNIFSYDIAWRFKSLSSEEDKYIKTYNRFKRRGIPAYVGEAIEIFKNSMFKLFLECMFLSDFDTEECVEFFGCDPKAINMYKKMFFDIGPVQHSKARMLSIAKSGRPNEEDLKLCAVKFGKEFVRWFIGMDEGLSDEYLEKMKNRLTDGIVIKSLGHEFTGSASREMNAYLKMINTIRSTDDKKQFGTSVTNIVDHFSKVFSKDHKKAEE